MLLTNEPDSQFGEKVLELLENAITVNIASGYIGLDTFRHAEPRFRKIVDAGGEVNIIVGRCVFEGLYEKTLTALRAFDQYCRERNPESGVKACAYKSFHGKLYLVENKNGERIASVGSSNFSNTGFGDWWEANLLVEDQSQVEEIQSYLQRLEESNAIDIAAVDIPIRGQKGNVKEKPSSPPNPIKLPAALGAPTFRLPIRATENEKKSHLNLFMGAGRKSLKMHPYDTHLPKSERRKIEVFKRRDWYEVEVGIKKQAVPNELLALLPDQQDPWQFTLVTEDGAQYSALFKRKTKDGEDSRSLREVGLDFMTNPRVDLGRILKGRLERMGLVRYGEPVTQEILGEANMEEMRFHKVHEDVFLLDL